MKKLLLNNKGVTIVEVVIAMSLVVVITSIAMTLSISSMTVSLNAQREFESANKCADFIEIFQESSNQSEYFALLESIYGITYTKDVNEAINFTLNDIDYNIQIFWNKHIIITSSCNDTKLYSMEYGAI